MYKSMRQGGLYKRILVIFALLFLSVILVRSSVSGHANLRKAKQNSYKYYTSIAVGKGDTLWSIASENMTPEYDKIEDYIQEIRSLNHLYGDGICAGEYLTIPRYFEEVSDHSGRNVQ